MGQNRMLFVDNIRLAMIVLVLFDHAAVTYSGVGGWYYRDPAVPGPLDVLILVFGETLCQSFFMGTLFALAGYYASLSLHRKGVRSFVSGRLVRLGLPTLLYVTVVHPLTVYYVANTEDVSSKIGFAGYYRLYVTQGHILSGTGPMWFALALLIFCLIYAAGAAVMPHRSGTGVRRPLGVGLVVSMILACAAGAFVIRLALPVGITVCNMQLGHFAQYILLFAFGAAARAGDWLRTADFRLGRGCLAVALAGTPVCAWLLAFGAGGRFDLVTGGLHWQSLVFALWESMTGVCMTVGLIAVGREAWNSQGRLVAAMSDGAFAVYVFHPPIMVALARGLAPFEMSLLAKCLLLFLVSVPVCFGAARIIRRTPIVGDLVRQ
ncbi:acyltransferase [Desulfovibrio sulfodismutans]|uniref:Acyltransferase n=1 Tax=Desulfolutivibrio sulfodismutans TaxID=63561 RepID=A0A7K3NQ14_9BACT|nr:acyltransferase family protein [Desulfolutivibrio sulfodismutans]NDY57885.1 acyltransferase [Desulfolutivibrio sulfodismutans]